MGATLENLSKLKFRYTLELDHAVHAQRCDAQFCQFGTIPRIHSHAKKCRGAVYSSYEENVR